MHEPVAPSASWAWQMPLQQPAFEAHANPMLTHVCGGQQDPSVQVFVWSQQSESW